MIAAFVLVAINAGNASSSTAQTVVVASKDLPARVPIDAGSLMLKPISVSGQYPAVFFHRVQDVQGLVPLVPIASNQAVSTNDVAKAGQTLGSQSAYLPIPSGYVALTIPTSEQQGVAGYIQPDDYVSVIATVSTAGKVASKTIFTNLHVIKVGMPSADNSTANASSLTIVVTECQAEVMTWFINYASLKYALESFHDYLTTTAQSPDPSCPTITAAAGVTLKVIQAAYPSLF